MVCHFFPSRSLKNGSNSEINSIGAEFAGQFACAGRRFGLPIMGQALVRVLPEWAFREAGSLKFVSKPGNFPPLAVRGRICTTLGRIAALRLRYLETLYFGRSAPFHRLPRGAKTFTVARRWASLKVLCSRAYNKKPYVGPGPALSFLLIPQYT
jgi:hypothetical protein